jgi:hypothetical protein
MKIAIFAFLMVIVLTLFESHKISAWRRAVRRTRHRVGQGRMPNGLGLGGLPMDFNNKLVQRDLGNGQNRYIREVNKEHHVHMSYERVPATRVARNAQTLKNVHERVFAETEDAGK